ncbi:amidohydrolase [Brevibacillus marinus]|uniref:amidohydrolase n=1 Tax=Brevibacillus marinus TaxID=2496837 RepID=UPI000F816CBD|nr:amidohydrolase [Brevibacillus marinus]
MKTQLKADMILSSNAVFTGLANEPTAAAIAIIGNKIAAIGSESEIEPYIGAETKIYRYDDKLIMPGFHDFHLHIMAGCISMNSAYLFDARTEEEAVEMVRAHAEAHPDEPWVIGFCWDSGYWDNKKLPHRSSLDRLLPDRPVVLFHAEAHYCWVNSKALELLNITRDTDNPPFGIIEKDENGELTGILYESAMSLVLKAAFDFSPERKREMLKGFLEHAASLGITSVHDLFAPDFNDSPANFELYRELEERGELTLRIHLWPELDGDLERVKQLRDTYQSSILRFAGLKQFIDGVITGYTAYMLEPYSDKPETRGKMKFPVETIKKWVIDADREGFSIRFHAIGDGAIRLALDAYEAAQQANGARDSRHMIEHVEVIHPDDIPRFKQLGVIASMQPNHLAMSERGVYTSRIGAQRERHVFVIHTLKQSGAKLAFGTDFPVDTLNPLPQIYRAVTRVDNSGVDVWHPQERITLAEALRAYTSVPAYGTFREHELGTLEVGKLADIVVLDRNLFAVPAEQILEAKVELTIVDGEIVYAR